MALEIGQVVYSVGVLPTQRGQTPDGTAAGIATTAAPEAPQAPPLTGVGGKPLSNDALQTLQGTDKEKSDKSDGQQSGEKDALGNDKLSDEDQKTVDALKKRDQDVRRHEAAHAAAGGSFAGSPTFSYQQGPDGKRYAIGGEVSIDVSPGRTPQETERKADTIRAAALAPADPSGQDRAVAAQATQMKLQAQSEAAKQRTDEQKAKDADKSEEPALPGQKKPEEKTPEIVGPKPIGEKKDGETGTESSTGTQKTSSTSGTSGSDSGPDRRIAAAANAYSRTSASVSREASNALSLVA